LTDTIKIEKINETFIKVHGEKSAVRELADKFVFTVPNYRFTPQYKVGKWDGKIKLLNLQNRFIYSGLRTKVESYARALGYKVEYISDFKDNEFTSEQALEFIKSLKLPKEFEVRDYQLNAFIKCIREKRRLTLLPTGSGKSLVIYLLARYFKKQVLIIVDTLSLVSQMRDDFIEYGCDPDLIHTIHHGKEKNVDCPITLSTWQSIYKLDREWFKKFECVIGDEVHIFSATSLKSIMEKLDKCEYRFGFSGTLDGAKSNELTLMGLFGPIFKGTSTKKLIDRGMLSQLNIKVLLLKHKEEMCQLMKDNRYDYQKEIEYLVGCEERNNFIKNLALSLKGNSLILFQYVQKHGDILYEKISKEAKDRNVYYIHGGIEGEERNRIRKIIETENDAIIIASRGTFNKGINIKRLHSIIFASPLKAKIANLQAIGRGLRKALDKIECVIYDVGDDLTVKSSKKMNSTLRHLSARLKIYQSENFNYKLYRMKIND
jgi:superfamily II DNA or RNA helicase